MSATIQNQTNTALLKRDELNGVPDHMELPDAAIKSLATPPPWTVPTGAAWGRIKTAISCGSPDPNYGPLIGNLDKLLAQANLDHAALKTKSLFFKKLAEKASIEKKSSLAE